MANRRCSSPFPKLPKLVAPTGGPRLADVLQEEGEFIGDLGARPKEPDPWYRPIGFVGSPLAAVLGLVGLGWVWRTWGREPKPQEVLGDYWREPLDDPPAVVVATIRSMIQPMALSSGELS